MCIYFYYLLEDQLIIHYYDFGYSYNEILAASFHMFALGKNCT